MGCSSAAARIVCQHRQCVRALVAFAETRGNPEFSPHRPMNNVILNDSSIIQSGTLHDLLLIVAVAQKRLARARRTRRSASWAILGSYRLV